MVYGEDVLRNQGSSLALIKLPQDLCQDSALFLLILISHSYANVTVDYTPERHKQKTVVDYVHNGNVQPVQNY